MSFQNSVLPTLRDNIINSNLKISSCRASTGLVDSQLLSPGYDKLMENQLKLMKKNIDKSKSPR